MARLASIVKGVPLLAALAHAANYPAKPADLTTPVQQRIAVDGASCELGCEGGWW